MEFVGEMPAEVEGESSGKVWYRCPKCRQAFLFDLVALEKERESSALKLEPKDCTEYVPTKTFSLGEAIFHSEWGDVGKVKAKEKTSSGAQAIVVSFERLGERRLIENLRIEETSPLEKPAGESNHTNSSQSEVI